MNTRRRSNLNAQGFGLLLKVSMGTDTSAAVLGIVGSRGTQVIQLMGQRQETLCFIETDLETGLY